MPITGKEFVRLYHAEKVNDLVPHGEPMELRLAIEEVLRWTGVDRIRAHIEFVDADFDEICGIGDVEACALSLGISSQPF